MAAQQDSTGALRFVGANSPPRRYLCSPLSGPYAAGLTSARPRRACRCRPHRPRSISSRAAGGGRPARHGFSRPRNRAWSCLCTRSERAHPVRAARENTAGRVPPLVCTLGMAARMAATPPPPPPPPAAAAAATLCVEWGQERGDLPGRAAADAPTKRRHARFTTFPSPRMAAAGEELPALYTALPLRSGAVRPKVRFFAPVNSMGTSTSAARHTNAILTRSNTVLSAG
jgi:hypothetical protein